MKLIRSTLAVLAIIGVASTGFAGNQQAVTSTGTQGKEVNIHAAQFHTPPATVIFFAANKDTTGLTAFAPLDNPSTVAFNAPGKVQIDVRKLGKTDTTAGAITAPQPTAASYMKTATTVTQGNTTTQTATTNTWANATDTGGTALGAHQPNAVFGADTAVGLLTSE